MLKTELFVARRFLFSGHKRFVSLLSLFSILGILLSVATFIVVMGVMSGAQHELKRRILGITPHVIVSRFFDEPVEGYEDLTEFLRQQPEVAAAAPFVYTKVMVSREYLTDGAVLKGVPADGGVKGPELRNLVAMGTFDLSPGHVLVGSVLASRLRVMPGDTLQILSPLATEPTPLGTMVRTRNFVVAGVFDAGMYDYNATLIFANLQDVAGLLGWNHKASGIEVDLRDPYRARKVARRLENALGYPFRAVSWMDLNKSLFAALALEKLAMFVILALMVLVASFSIVATLTIMVSQKTREIGILRSLGMSEHNILRVFLYTGLLIGVTGTLLGLALGMGIAFFVEHSPWFRLPPDVYFVDHLPVMLKARDVVLVTVVAWLTVLLTSLFPARRASRLDPVEAIRYE